jgi:hypothetical protein
VLAYLRKGETFTGRPPVSASAPPLPGGYVSETVALLAARSRKLRQALAAANKAGHAHVVRQGLCRRRGPRDHA